MGFFSDIGDSLSDAWDSVKDTVKDVTGIDSMNDLLMPGFGVASGMAALQGRGAIGEFLQPLMGAPPMAGGMPQMTGPLMGNAPASLTMGAGGVAPAQTVTPSNQDIAALFGESGYQYGPNQTSTALLQANPEAYQYTPLMSGLS